MAKKFLTPVVPPSLSSDPASGTAGAIYYNTVSNSLKYYNGTSWTTVGGSGTSTIQALASAPNNPVEGSVYFDTQEATIKVYNGYVWYDAAGPKEILDHTHYAGDGRVKEAWYGDYVVDELVFLDGGTSTTVYSDDIIDGGSSNG